MSCKILPASPGITAIVCGRGSKPKPCFYCKRPSVALCDFVLTTTAAEASILLKEGAPAPKERTCDRPMCETHRKAIAKNVDHCVWHTDPKNPEAVR